MKDTSFSFITLGFQVLVEVGQLGEILADKVEGFLLWVTGADALQLDAQQLPEAAMGMWQNKGMEHHHKGDWASIAFQWSSYGELRPCLFQT